MGVAPVPWAARSARKPKPLALESTNSVCTLSSVDDVGFQDTEGARNVWDRFWESTSVLALCFSSMTQESRYAGFGWFAVWILGWFTYTAASSAEAFEQMNAHQDVFRPGGQIVLQQSSWTHVSLYHTLGRVQSWVFGFAEFRDVMVSAVILIGVTLIALAILLRRISAPMRV